MINGNGKTHHLLNGAPKAGSPRLPLTRGIVSIVAVVVLIIAAIAYVNLSDGEPASRTDSGTPTGYAHTRNGAKQAAPAYAATLGGKDMFNERARARIVEAVVAPEAQDKLRAGFDEDYSEKLNAKIGLTPEGEAPGDATFVNRTMPAGVRLTAYNGTTASVSVWCSGMLGITGKDSPTPVRTNWFTIDMTLKWTQDDWKLSDFTQKAGPTPKNSDGSRSPAGDVDKTVGDYEEVLP